MSQFVDDLDRRLLDATSVHALVSAHSTAIRGLRRHLFLDRAHARLSGLFQELLQLCVQTAHCHFQYQSGGAAKLVLQKPRLRPRRRRRRSGIAESDDEDDDEGRAQVLDAFGEAAAHRQRIQSHDSSSAGAASVSMSVLHVSALSISAASASYAELQETDFEQQLVTLESHLRTKVRAFQAALAEAIEHAEATAPAAAKAHGRADTDNGTALGGSAGTRELFQSLASTFKEWS